MEIRKAEMDDITSIKDLLGKFNLPLEGLEENISNMLLGFIEGKLVASAGLEIYGKSGLLRSVAVHGSFRDKGYGESIVEACFRFAAERALTELFLLTTTAENYFPRFGFSKVDRTDVPDLVKTSIEFANSCPLSAVVMVKFL